jgi:cyanate permease
MTASTDTQSGTSNYKWYVLTLAALTHTAVVAIPMMSMPVLFDEIAKELGLTLVEIGWVWGIGFLTGITGALRGLSDDFVTLAGATFIFGLVTPAIPMNVHKTCGVWFSGRHLGLANGIVSAGMALGFMLGSLLSATVLSPWLGGWRQVLFLYGVLSIVVGISWSFTRAAPAAVKSPLREEKVSLGHGLPYVARIRNVWLLGLMMFGIGGCIQGALGYLPLYLRGIGWPGTNADVALAAFHGVSMMATIPIALLSDRLGSRKGVLMVATLMISTGVALLSLPGGILVWVAVIIAGFVRDGFMAILMTLIIELKGVGTMYAGTAIGMVLVFSRLGSLISPPLGNSLADFNLALPFIFWAGLAVMGSFCLYFVKEGG